MIRRHESARNTIASSLNGHLLDRGIRGNDAGRGHRFLLLDGQCFCGLCGRGNRLALRRRGGIGIIGALAAIALLADRLRFLGGGGMAIGRPFFRLDPAVALSPAIPFGPLVAFVPDAGTGHVPNSVALPNGVAICSLAFSLRLRPPSLRSLGAVCRGIDQIGKTGREERRTARDAVHSLKLVLRRDRRGHFADGHHLILEKQFSAGKMQTPGHGMDCNKISVSAIKPPSAKRGERRQPADGKTCRAKFSHAFNARAGRSNPVSSRPSGAALKEWKNCLSSSTSR